MEIPLYQLFYEGEKPPEIPSLPKRKTADDIAWGSMGKEAHTLSRFRKALGGMEEGDRKLLLHMARKMAVPAERRLSDRRSRDILGAREDTSSLFSSFSRIEAGRS